MLFPEPILDELRRMPGAHHSFVKQLASNSGHDLRVVLEEEVDRAPPDVAERWTDLLRSLDNRRFFQGFAELSTCRVLGAKGWTLLAQTEPGPALVLHDADGRLFHGMALGFIRQVRLMPDREMVQTLARSLNRVGSRSRIAVLVRRWLPHDFDPEPVRRAIDLWLGEVDRGGWDGRYAAYDDEHVSLEFALTGEKATDDQGVVAFTLGPFDSQRVLEALESRIIFELDSHRMRSSDNDVPIIVSAVADQPWRVSPGYLRDLLYGKPRRVSTASTQDALYCNNYAPSLFRDPVYRNVAGVMMVDRPPHAPVALRAESFLNPWAHCKVDHTVMPGPTLTVDRWEDDCPVVRWKDEL